jgi:hypothetical protein
MATSSAEPEFLTPAQLMQRWQGQVASATLATWRSRNLGPPYVKVGGRVLYRVADVAAWEERNRRCRQ